MGNDWGLAGVYVDEQQPEVQAHETRSKKQLRAMSRHDEHAHLQSSTRKQQPQKLDEKDTKTSIEHAANGKTTV